MIANLVTTCLLALGVATGNVSSNSYKSGNAFNHVEKQKNKPILRAQEEVDQTYIFHKTQEYQTNNGLAKKYVLNTIDRESNNANVNNGYFNIYNTVYFVNSDTGNGYNALLLTFMKITTYFNFGTTDLTINQNYSCYNNGTSVMQYYVNRNNFTTTQNIDEFFDMQLNANTINQLENYRNLIQRENEYYYTDYITAQSSSLYPNPPDIDNEYTITNMVANETYYIVMVFNFIVLGSNYRETVPNVTPNNLNIEGLTVLPTVNYEVIDVPNLMFTILTLPFAWYSTAFNLTIFPNTPYQLNFGNLVMTIVAALILLYLIRKIIK